MIIRVLHVVASPTVFILFYEQRWVGGVFKVIKKRSLFSIFNRWGPLFVQVKEWLILELHETRMERYSVMIA